MRGVEQIPWVYDLTMVVLEKSGLGPWRRWLADVPGNARILDLGCGTGRNLALLRGRQAVGVDPCPESLQAARHRAPGAWLVRARAEHLPFRAATFDIVLSGLVFCSVEEPAAGLAEIRRVLRPGGRLRMLEHVRAASRWQAWLQDRLQPAWTRFTGGCRPNRETEQVVADAGFVVVPGTRRASGTMRRFEARPPAD